MQVTESNARKLLAALGAPHADVYVPRVLVKRLERIEQDYADRVRMSVNDPVLSRMIRAIITANRMDEVLVIVRDVPVKPKPAEEPVSLNEVEEEEEVPEGPKPRPAKKTRLDGRTARKPHREGTIKRTVFEALVKATEEAPLTKDMILEVVGKKYPKKGKAALATTVNGFPHWIPIHYPYDVVKVDGGYRLEPWSEK